jgi:hypothetical protein
MSNVLIGIIGVILFIGLALAGALILGDDFKSANSDSKAAAVMSTLGQIAAGANMSTLKTGVPYSSDTVTPLMPRFVKSVPSGIGESYPFGFRTASGPLSPGPMAFALTAWAADSTEGRYVCSSIAQTYGVVLDATGEPPRAPAPTGGVSGCIKLNADWGGVRPGTYVAWVRL